MTEKDIITALETIEPTEFEKVPSVIMEFETAKEILDLIKRKQAEIYHLREAAKMIKIKAFKEFAEMLKAKIDKNGSMKAIYQYCNHGDGGYYLAVDVDEDIDNLVKELTEVSNG